jgi:hypothetical protein
MSNNPFSDAFSKQVGVSPDLLKLVSAMSPDLIANWLHTIDESAYTIEELAESVVAFHQWAERAGRKLTLQHMLEYLSCCAESANSAVKLPLTFLMQEFINTNGVE